MPMSRIFKQRLGPAPARTIDLTIPNAPAMAIHGSDSEPECTETQTDKSDNETQTQIEHKTQNKNTSPTQT